MAAAQLQPIQQEEGRHSGSCRSGSQLEQQLSSGQHGGHMGPTTILTAIDTVTATGPVGGTLLTPNERTIKM